MGPYPFFNCSKMGPSPFLNCISKGALCAFRWTVLRRRFGRLRRTIGYPRIDILYFLTEKSNALAMLARGDVETDERSESDKRRIKRLLSDSSKLGWDPISNSLVRHLTYASRRIRLRRPEPYTLGNQVFWITYKNYYQKYLKYMMWVGHR